MSLHLFPQSKNSPPSRQPRTQNFSMTYYKSNNHSPNTQLIQQIDSFFRCDSSSLVGVNSTKTGTNVSMKKQNSKEKKENLKGKLLSLQEDKSQRFQYHLKYGNELEKLMNIFHHYKTKSLQAPNISNGAQRQKQMLIESGDYLDRSYNHQLNTSKSQKQETKKYPYFNDKFLINKQSKKLSNEHFSSEGSTKFHISREFQNESSPVSNLGRSIDLIFQEKDIRVKSLSPRSFKTKQDQTNNYFIKQVIENFNKPKLMSLVHQKHVESIYQDLKKQNLFPQFSIQNRAPQISNRSSIKRIVLGLDKTLVFCKKGLRFVDDCKIKVQLPDGRLQEAFVKIRPYCTELIEFLAKHFELVVFSASHKNYVSRVVELIDQNKKIKKIYSIDNCKSIDDKTVIKDINVVGKNLNDTLFVDTQIASYRYQYEQKLSQKISQVIPVIPYYGESNDVELKKLIEFFQSDILTSDKPFDVIRKYFQLEKWSKYPSGYKAVKSLYR